MPNAKPYRIKSITEIHRLMGLPKPHHPLISMVDLKGLRNDYDVEAVVFELYVISMKKGCNNLIYGQQKYDFDEGFMAFMSPGQILRGDENGVPPELEGWMLFVHPDFLWNTALATKIRKYEYFGYATNEALFLSDKEKKVINDLVSNIKTEYHAHVDQFSQNIIVSNLETLLNYAERFYQRQFITRKISSHKIVDRMEQILEAYLSNEALLSTGLPTVQYMADALHVSSKYLSSLLKQLTGQTMQQIIHEKLIDKAKEILSTTELSVAEIAYQLGFEHPQSFNKLFKNKTRQSPLEFRQAFN